MAWNEYQVGLRQIGNRKRRCQCRIDTNPAGGDPNTTVYRRPGSSPAATLDLVAIKLLA